MMKFLPLFVASSIVLFSYFSSMIFAFVVPVMKSPLSPSLIAASITTTRKRGFDFAKKNTNDDCGPNNTKAYDDGFSFDDFDNDYDPEFLDSSCKKLGIDIDLMPDNDLDRMKLTEECKRMINEKIENGIDELNKIRERWQRDLKYQQEPLEQAMAVNGMRESKKLNEKVDLLIGNFMNETRTSRQRTHLLAYEDDQRIKAEEREKERQQKKKNKSKGYNAWTKTNNEWDKEWDDDW
jgi:hypothetical protein